MLEHSRGLTPLKLLSFFEQPSVGELLWLKLFKMVKKLKNMIYYLMKQLRIQDSALLQ